MWFITAQFRLTGGRTSNEGRVEVGDGIEWVPVCSHHWNTTSAGVLCRELGYSGALAAYQGGHFGEGSGDMIYDHFHCEGDEDSLLECTHRRAESDCISPDNDASVICVPNGMYLLIIKSS